MNRIGSEVSGDGTESEVVGCSLAPRRPLLRVRAESNRVELTAASKGERRRQMRGTSRRCERADDDGCHCARACLMRRLGGAAADDGEGDALELGETTRRTFTRDGCARSL